MESIASAKRDVAAMQATLTSVQSGLDTLEAAAGAVQDARRGLRRAVKVGLVVGVVVLVIALVSSKRAPHAPDEDA